jgi:hypothetical protein
MTPEGILYDVVKPGVVVTLADAREIHAAYRKVAGGRRRPLLVDMREIKRIERGAREYLSGPESAEISLAAALLVGSALTRAVGNFLINRHRPRQPVRLYTQEAEALRWLRGFLPRTD